MNRLIYVATCLAATSLLSSGAVPTGSISLNKAVARQGYTPSVTWDIQYPLTKIDEVIDFGGNPEEDPGVIPGTTIKTKTKLKVEVFMVGTAVSNHREATESLIQLDGVWSEVYKGKGLDLDSSVARITKIIPRGSEVKFKARRLGSYWSYAGQYYSNTSKNVLTMVDGARPSSKAGWGGDTSMEDYVRPYLGSDGAFDLGKLDIMFAAELTHSQDRIDEAGYDSNDSIVLVRFTPVD